ncbi:MAG TPA: GNAT family N-acetyltransferase [Rubrobacteraceae bacterium]|nr:GNAT family N-acetyltransferase [Rubrobacteraceae bacterium]
MAPRAASGRIEHEGYAMDLKGDLGMVREWRRGAYLITTDKGRLNLETIHGFLKTSYWASGIPAETVRRSVEKSLTFGLFADEEQVGVARVVTDYATFAYLADVFVLESHRGRGLGKWLMEVVSSRPELQGLRRWMLATRDAHGLYREYGFAELENPQIFMEKYSPYE